MDPQACLERFWDLEDDGQHIEAAEARDDLLTWLGAGGFEPDWEYNGHTKEDFLTWELI